MGWYFEESPRARDAVGIKRSGEKITDPQFLSTDFHTFFRPGAPISRLTLYIEEDGCIVLNLPVHYCPSHPGGPIALALRRIGTRW